MRTLFITPSVPFPPNSGRKQRFYHLLRAVAKAGEVTLVCFLANDSERSGLDSLRSLCGEIHALPPGAWGIMKDLQLPKPLLLAKSIMNYCHPTRPALFQWYHSIQGRQLVALLCAQKFDLIWVEKLPTTTLLPPGLRTRVVVDLDDIEHQKLAHRLRHAPFYRMAPLHFLEFLKLRRLERNLVHSPYEFVVCSETDRGLIARGSCVWVIPNGVDMPASAAPEPLGTQPNFLFVGTMDYAPNVDAVRFFASRILPRIRREAPGARFFIVGRDPSPAVRHLHDGKTITVTGTVSEVESYLGQATVVVVPIRFGGGTRIKILEAMANRKAVVSTTIGAEGIDCEPGKHFILADDPAAFADACLLLLQNRALRKRLGDQAYSLVFDYYQWSQIEPQVERIVTANFKPALREAMRSASGGEQ